MRCALSCPVPGKQSELVVFVLRQDLVPQEFLTHMPLPPKCPPHFFFNCMLTHLCSVVLSVENWPRTGSLFLPCGPRNQAWWQVLLTNEQCGLLHDQLSAVLGRTWGLMCTRKALPSKLGQCLKDTIPPMSRHSRISTREWSCSSHSRCQPLRAAQLEGLSPQRGRSPHSPCQDTGWLCWRSPCPAPSFPHIIKYTRKDLSRASQAFWLSQPPL